MSQSLKLFFKRVIITYSYLLGNFIPYQMIRLGYLIKLSKWYKSHRLDHFETRDLMYSYLCEKEQLKDTAINYLEFGVHKGESIKWWISHNVHEGSTFSGFDTFTGLPEDWGRVKAGTFNVDHQLPDIKDKRCQLVPGLFQNTLSKFLIDFKSDKRLVINMDADLYSSTLYVLVKLTEYFKKDDIIIFDEYYSIMAPQDEYRAFIDFLTIHDLKYEVIANSKYAQLAIKIC